MSPTICSKLPEIGGTVVSASAVRAFDLPIQVRRPPGRGTKKWTDAQLIAVDYGAKRSPGVALTPSHGTGPSEAEDLRHHRQASARACRAGQLAPFRMRVASLRAHGRPIAR